MYRNHSSKCAAPGILQGMYHGRIRAPSVPARFFVWRRLGAGAARIQCKVCNAPYHESCFYATSSTSTMKVDDRVGPCCRE